MKVIVKEVKVMRDGKKVMGINLNIDFFEQRNFRSLGVNGGLTLDEAEEICLAVMNKLIEIRKRIYERVDNMNGI